MSSARQNAQNLIALDLLRRQVAHVAMVIGSASAAHIFEQLEDGAFRQRLSCGSDRVDAASFHRERKRLARALQQLGGS